MDPLKISQFQPGVLFQEKKKVDEKKRSSQLKVPFEDLVEETKQVFLDQTYTEEDLAKLLDLVWQEGAALIQKPSGEQMEKYRKAISVFVEAIVQMSYKTTTSKGALRKNGDRPVYTLIQVINQKLDELGRAILQGQKDPLEILRRTDELKGLLVNLKI
jgi:uncharacterized protein YaaR (DUF327 family)